MPGDRDAELALERGLVARAKAGDRAAFGELFQLYRRPIYRLCMQQLGNPALAEDTVQETFLRAFVALRGFDSARRFFPWLASIASNRAIDMWKESSRSTPSDDLDAGGPQRYEPDHAAGVTERVRLKQALARLPAGQQRMLLLHEVDGLSCQEVAASEGRSELAVRSALFRARNSMKAMLRTLGLAGVWVRLTGRRATNRVGRVFAWPIPINDLLVGLTATVIALSVPATAANLDRRVTTALTTSSVRSESSAPITNDAQREPGDSSSLGQPLGSPGVRVTSHVKEPRAGTVVPPSGNFRVEVQDLDGHTIYYDEYWFGCDEVATLPSPPAQLPVRAAC